MSRVRVKSPDGRRATVPAEKLEQAKALGFEVEPEDSSALGAAAAGAARGFTAGASDVGLTQFSKHAEKFVGSSPEAEIIRQVGAAVSPESLRQLREGSPVASTLGEVGGVVGGLVTKAGAPAAIAKVGAGATHALGGGLAARAAGGAVEGGLYGLGALVSEESLSDRPDLTAEKLFAATGPAALLGGGLVGGAGLVGKGGGLLMSKMGGKGMRAALEDFAERQAVSSFALKSDFTKGKLADQKVIGRYALNKGLSAGDDAYAVRDKFLPVREQEAQRIYGVLQQVDERALGFDTARFEVKARKILDKIKDDPAFGGHHGGYATLKRMVGEYGDKPRSFKEMWDLQSSLRRTIGEGDPLYGVKDKLDDLRRLMRDEIIEQVGEVSPHFTPMLRAASRDYRSAAKMAQLAEKQIEGIEGNRRFSLTDQMLGSTAGLGTALATGNPLGLVAGLATAQANKVARLRGGSFVAVTADKVAKSKTLERLSKSLHRTLDEGLRASPTFGGAARATLERAVARGSLDSLAAHVQLARSDPEYLSSVGMADETPDAANQYAVRADQLEGISGIVAEQDRRIELAIGRFLGKQSGPAPKTDEEAMTPERFQEQFARLAQLVQNPQAMASAFTPSDALRSAPTLSALASAAGVRAAQFLYEKAPKNPFQESMPALSDAWEPSATDLERWSRYVDAVERPQKVLADLRDGIVTRESAEALGVVYPALLAEIQERLMSRLAEFKEPLPYPQRLALSTLFGVPIGGAGSPDRLRLLQEAHRVTETEDKAAKAKVAQSSGNLAATQSQRIEARGMQA
jgi:hypothetical protein